MDDDLKVAVPATIDLHGASPLFLMQNLEWFCCAFVQDVSPCDEQMDIDKGSAFVEVELKPKQTNKFSKIQIDYQRLK